MIKVVGGKHRGRALATPEGLETRPTSSRARESLFNILAHATRNPGGTSPLVGARVLDAFAGSGALGIEALSRGAAHASFLDSDATAIRLIGENLRKIGEAANARVIRADATRPPTTREGCDLAFLDPPYRKDLIAPALAGLRDGGWLVAPAVVVAEMADEENYPPTDGFELVDDRLYGDTRVVILKTAP